MLFSLLALASCATDKTSLSVASALTNYERGMARTAADEQSGFELGLQCGDDRVVGEVAIRRTYGDSTLTNGSVLSSTQTLLQMGGRLYASRDWVAQPYIGGGVVYRHDDLESGWSESDSAMGVYWRAGLDVPVTDSLKLSIGWQNMETGKSSFGDRRQDLSESAVLIGISLSL